jgi:trk system potassium uptake protein TrkA
MRVLIAGGGEVALLIARRLSREGNEVTVVEENADRCLHLEEQVDAHVVQGSALSVATLLRAGIREAEMFIAVTNVDSVNLLACMVAQPSRPAPSRWPGCGPTSSNTGVACARTAT